MKNRMKKQCKKNPLWGIKGLLMLALSGLGAAAFAQGAEVCAGTAYTIANTEDASVGATYQWLENGKLIPNASAAAYTVPNNKAAGLYTYIRQAKSADCEVWQSSNEFAVTVFNCSFSAGTATAATATFTDPRDGKSYKTVVMPDGKTWFAQNLNYTKDLTYNAYAYGGPNLIGSYWCPPLYWVNGAETESIASGSEADCRTYGALYVWYTAMMVDGKYADEEKTSTAWDESWVSPYYFDTGAPGSTPNADKNNARGGTYTHGGGRGICPMGWHVPTTLEWAHMLDKVDGAGTNTLFTDQTIIEWLGTDVGKKLKSSGTFSLSGTDPGDGSWLATGHDGADSYHFSVVPAGYRSNGADFFWLRGRRSYTWTSTPVNRYQARDIQFIHHSNQAWSTFNSRIFGYSVRCIKD